MFSHADGVTFKNIDVVGSYFQFQSVTNIFFYMRQGGLKKKICLNAVNITVISWVPTIDCKVAIPRTTKKLDEKLRLINF